MWEPLPINSDLAQSWKAVSESAMHSFSAKINSRLDRLLKNEINDTHYNFAVTKLLAQMINRTPLQKKENRLGTS